MIGNATRLGVLDARAPASRRRRRRCSTARSRARTTTADSARSPGAMPLAMSTSIDARRHERDGDQHGGVGERDGADADDLADQQLLGSDDGQQHLDDARRLLPRHRRDDPLAVGLQQDEQQDVGDRRRHPAAGVGVVAVVGLQRLDGRRRGRPHGGGLVGGEPGGPQPVLQGQVRPQHVDDRRQRRAVGRGRPRRRSSAGCRRRTRRRRRRRRGRPPRRPRRRARR